RCFHRSMTACRRESAPIGPIIAPLTSTLRIRYQSRDMTVAVSHSVRPRTLFAVGPALVAVVLAAGAALAQSRPQVAPQAAPQVAPEARAAKPPVEDVRQRDRELEAVRADQRRSIDAEKRLREEIAGISEDRRKLNQALIDSAAEARKAEGRVADA